MSRGNSQWMVVTDLVILTIRLTLNVWEDEGDTYPEGHRVLVPEVKALVAEVGGSRRGHVLEVVITWAVIQAGLAVTVTVIVSTPNSFAWHTIKVLIPGSRNVQKLQNWPTVFVFFPVFVNWFSIFVYFASSLHFLHLSSLVLKPNLDNANWKTRVFRESLPDFSARFRTNLKGGLKPTTFQKEQVTGFMTSYLTTHVKILEMDSRLLSPSKISLP